MATITVPVFFGWDAFNKTERMLTRRGKTHAGVVVVDETGVIVDACGITRHHNRSSLGPMAPSFQFPPSHAEIDTARLTVVGWIGGGS